MQVVQHYAGWRSQCKKHQGPLAWGVQQCSPNRALGPGLEFEHVMLGPEKRRAMLE